MKIIHLILGKANPERMASVNKLVHALATQQHRAGADVAVWSIAANLATDAHPAREFATRLFLAKRNPFGLASKLMVALRELVSSPVVVHLHGAFIPVYFTVARRLTALGIPYVLTPHGSYSPAAMGKSRLTKMLYGRVFESYLLRRAAHVHLLDQHELAGSPPLRAQLPPSFAPPTPVAPATPAAPGRFRVGFCDRLDDHHKGLECLLTGFTEFARQVPEAELWIIGDGPDRAKVDTWAQAAPPGSVQLLGSRHGDDKIALLGQLHVLAHTSHYEGLPAAVLEAMALGVPCVVTEATNLGSYVREFKCGEVLPTPDPALLAHALHRLYYHWLSISDTDPVMDRCREIAGPSSALMPNFEQLYKRVLAA